MIIWQLVYYYWDLADSNCYISRLLFEISHSARIVWPSLCDDDADDHEVYIVSHDLAIIVMVAWDGNGVVSRCLPQIPGRGSENLSHLFAYHPAKTRLLFPREGRAGRSLIAVKCSQPLFTGWDLYYFYVVT